MFIFTFILRSLFLMLALLIFNTNASAVSINTATYNTSTARLAVPNLAISVKPLFGGTPVIQNFSIELQQGSASTYSFNLDQNSITQFFNASADNCTATYSSTTTRLVVPCLAVSITPLFGGAPVIQNFSIELQQRSGGGYVFDLVPTP